MCLNSPYKCQSHQSKGINFRSHLKAVSSSLTLGRKAAENVRLSQVSSSLSTATSHIKASVQGILRCIISHQCQGLQVLPGPLNQCYCQVTESKAIQKIQWVLSKIQWWLWSGRKKGKNGRCKNNTWYYLKPEIFNFFTICVIGNYSYMSLRARTPSVERNPETSNKQLRFPRSNLTSTKNLTLLIKSQQSKTKTKHHEDYLPVEVVAVGGKPGKQSDSAGELWPENYTYTSKISQVGELKIFVQFFVFVSGNNSLQQWY